MKILECYHCDKKITENTGGIKYNDLYFCSQECLEENVNWLSFPIVPTDFEVNGWDDDEEDCLENEEGR